MWEEQAVWGEDRGFPTTTLEGVALSLVKGLGHEGLG